MAEIDVSSYPKAGMPVSPLDTAAKVGALQQQKLQIDAAKMDQANKALGFMTRAMGSLGPNATKEEYAAVAQNAVQQGLVPQQQLNSYMDRLQKAPTPQAFYNEFITAASETQKQMDYHLGQRQDVGDGQTVTPAVTSVKPGFGVRPVGLPVQQQAPPTTPTMDPVSGQPRLLGPQPAAIPEGAAPANTGFPGQFKPAGARPMPVEPMAPPARTTGPTGPTVRTDSGPDTFDGRFAASFPKPAGPATGPTPLFEEGKKAYTEDQRNAGQRAFAIKPAIQALKLMPGLATGPGTDQFTNLVAAAKAWGIVDTKAENDPTVLRQELNKKLAQYVGSSPIGQRSDAAQTLAEAGSPNPKVQVTQALQNLTRDAIALDRVQILKPQAFKTQKFDDYIKHGGTFPTSVDEKALTLDLMDEKERDKLVAKMKLDYRNGDNVAKKKATRFFETVDLAKNAKIYDVD